jgi:hypothetical protein
MALSDCGDEVVTYQAALALAHLAQNLELRQVLSDHDCLQPVQYLATLRTGPVVGEVVEALCNLSYCDENKVISNPRVLPSDPPATGAHL